MALFRGFLHRSHPLANQIDEHFRISVRANGKVFNRNGSWFEPTRRLAGNLFHLGRLGEPTRSKQKCLSKSIELLDFLLQNDRATQKPAMLLKYCGFRGVSCMLLARSSNDPAKLYREAVHNLQRSRGAGDLSLENAQYLAEACLYLHELCPTEGWLAKAESSVSEIQNSPKAARRAFALCAEAAIQRGFANLAAEKRDQALVCFQNAEAFSTRALHAPPDSNADDAHLHRMRGRSRYQAATTTAWMTEATPVQILDDSIDDLEFLRSDGTATGVGGRTLPRALFLRARSYREAGDLSRTKDYLERAHGTALQAPGAEDLLRSIRVMQCALEIEDTIASNDPARIVVASTVIVSDHGKNTVRTTRTCCPRRHQTRSLARRRIGGRGRC
jgi:hypothetical protein